MFTIRDDINAVIEYVEFEIENLKSEKSVPPVHTENVLETGVKSILAAGLGTAILGPMGLSYAAAPIAGYRRDWIAKLKEMLPTFHKFETLGSKITEDIQLFDKISGGLEFIRKLAEYRVEVLHKGEENPFADSKYVSKRIKFFEEIIKRISNCQAVVEKLRPLANYTAEIEELKKQIRKLEEKIKKLEEQKKDRHGLAWDLKWALNAEKAELDKAFKKGLLPESKYKDEMQSIKNKFLQERLDSAHNQLDLTYNQLDLAYNQQVRLQKQMGIYEQPDSMNGENPSNNEKENVKTLAPTLDANRKTFGLTFVKYVILSELLFVFGGYTENGESGGILGLFFALFLIYFSCKFVNTAMLSIGKGKRWWPLGILFLIPVFGWVVVYLVMRAKLKPYGKWRRKGQIPIGVIILVLILIFPFLAGSGPK